MDNQNSQHIKDDICFLEYPTWIISERNKSKTLTIEKENGKYVISTSEDADKLPDRGDKIILYYLLHLILPTKESKLITTRYDILKSAFNSTSKHYYNRIINSLSRWLSVTIKFEGIFYTGDGYTTRGFHIIDGYKLNEDGKLVIYFNEQYLEQLRETNCYKLIDFNEYKKLKRPIAARLYEILIKTFKDRDIWKIGIIKLAEKLTLEKRKGKKNYYPSDIFVKLKPAVKEINENTDLKILLHYDKKTHICTFTKVEQDQVIESETKTKEANFSEDNNFKIEKTQIEKLSIEFETDIPKEIFDNTLLKEILDMKVSKKQANSLIKNYDIDVIQRNIELTKNKMADRVIDNTPGFLIEAIKNDYAKDQYPEDLKSQELRTEATACWNKNKGNCRAKWSTYKDNRSKACHYCLRFKDQRNKIKSEIIPPATLNS